MARKLVFHKRFEKQFAILKPAQKERVKEVLRDFANGERALPQCVFMRYMETSRAKYLYL